MEQRDRIGRIASVTMTALLGLTSPAEAQLTGGQVVAGHATISNPTATSTLIQQTTQKTIINWSSFSIPSGSSVTFQQPGASSIALNRVTGGNASLIYGSLTANGQVWLINRNGIVVGPSAQLSAATLLLSTIDIHDQDFIAGNYIFGTPGSPGASIVNQGRIVAASGGAVYLAAPQIRNEGLIEADLGTIVLAGTKTVAVDFAGDDLLKFAVSTASVDAVPPGTNALVTNTGTISAPGGRVLLTAAAAKGVIDNVINTSGIIEATSVASVNGKIVLSATGGGMQVSGTLDTVGTGTGYPGGAIDIFTDGSVSGPGIVFAGAVYAGNIGLVDTRGTATFAGAVTLGGAITLGDAVAFGGALVIAASAPATGSVTIAASAAHSASVDHAAAAGSVMQPAAAARLWWAAASPQAWPPAAAMADARRDQSALLSIVPVEPAAYDGVADGPRRP